jgi:hypothetical protein
MGSIKKVCDPAGGSFEHHLEYVGNPYQKDSADFIIAAFKGTPLPKAPRTFTDLGWTNTTTTSVPFKPLV